MCQCRGTVASVRRGVAGRLGVLVVWLWGALVAAASDDSMRAMVKEDWLQQARRWSMSERGATKTQGDAAGAVDGLKDGKYAFHTGQEPNPWWQVDLGEVRAIARLVVFNRLDYAPGLHNADHLRVLTSDDGREWTVRHENRGQHFGGISGATPLDVSFPPGLAGRFVRLQIPSDQPIFLHLDEVEIYGPDDPEENIALRRPADQSSLSPWSTNKLPPPGLESALPPFTELMIEHGLKLADDLARRGVETGEAVERLRQWREQSGRQATALSEREARDLYFAVRWTVRELAWQNPLLDFDQLLLVKRFTQQSYPDICLNHMPWVSRPGGDICVLTLDGPRAEPNVRYVLDGKLGPGHVHGIDLHWDAQRVVFGYAIKDSDQPPEGWLDRTTSYHLRRTVEPIRLFEIHLDGSNLRQLTYGEWSDLDPAYLPNEDIVFVSERCGYSLQCNEWDKDETSCNLYVMHPNGSNLRRLSASKDGDYLPHCLDDGTIGYCRWEYQERGWAHIQSIWTVRPDGTGADALFKQHINDPWALEGVRSIPGSGTRQLVAVAAGHHTLATGPIVIVTPTVGMNDSRGIEIVTPDVLPPEGGMSGFPVPEGGTRDGGGLYSTPWALSNKFFLAAYSFSDEQTEPTGYGIYLVDVYGNKELIYRDPDISCFTPIPLRPRVRPLVLTDHTDPRQGYATVVVAEAAFGVDGVPPESARYLRVAHRLPWPYDNHYGGHRYHEVPHTQVLPPNWTPVRILGDVPLDADGSARFQVPADLAVYFQLLDENRMEIRRMRSFISFQPGEERMCLGCHETRGEAPLTHRFPTAAIRDPSPLIPPPWGDVPVSFLRDIQPIFDQHCTSCHSGLKPAADLDFSGGLTARGVIPAFGSNRAYETIRVHELVSRSDVYGDARITMPYDFGSHRSELIDVLREGECGRRAALTSDQILALVTWVDANAPYHANFVRKREEVEPYDLPADTQLIEQIASVHARRCQSCHESAAITRPDWIDIFEPQRSRFLVAPLARSAGGSQQCGEVIYRDQQDADYRTLAELLDEAVQRAWERPRRDLQLLPPPVAPRAHP